MARRRWVEKVRQVESEDEGISQVVKERLRDGGKGPGARGASGERWGWGCGWGLREDQRGKLVVTPARGGRNSRGN